MIFSREALFDPFFGRLSLFEKKMNYEGWLSHCLKTEPHTLYNMGYVLNFIKNSDHAGKVLGIGIDPIKETILIQESKFDQIDVYDIDAEAVEAGNRYWENTSNNVRYYCKNILHDEINLNYDTALFFQMDYIFSDVELSLIIKKFKQSRISDCYVITPSLFNINLNKPTSPDIFIYDVFNIFFYLFKSLKLTIKPKTNLRSDQSTLVTYKRTKNHLTKLFTEQNITIIAQKSIINSNGSFNLFHFKL